MFPDVYLPLDFRIILSSIVQSFSALQCCFQTQYGDFPRINNLAFFGISCCFLPPFHSKATATGLCGVVAIPGSLSGREWICILIRCKGESNIAHYFHVPVEAAVVLHHCKFCKLSAVWIPQEEVCVCVGGGGP